MSKPDPMKPKTCVGRWLLARNPSRDFCHQRLRLVHTVNNTCVSWRVPPTRPHRETDHGGWRKPGGWETWAHNADVRVMPAGWNPGDPIPAEVPELPDGWWWVYYDGPVATDGNRVVYVEQGCLTTIRSAPPIAVVKAVLARWEAENG